MVAVLIGSGFQHVAVLNRHLHRAEALVGHFSRSARHMELRARPWHDAIIEAELARAELLVNASGIGVEEGESPIPADLLAAGTSVAQPLDADPATTLCSCNAVTVGDVKTAIGRGGLRPGEWQEIMNWAEVGKVATFFHNGGASETYIATRARPAR